METGEPPKAKLSRGFGGGQPAFAKVAPGFAAFDADHFGEEFVSGAGLGWGTQRFSVAVVAGLAEV